MIFNSKFHGHSIEVASELVILGADQQPKSGGNIWIRGWDIPITWIIDHRNACYKSTGHSSLLERCTEQELLSEARVEGDEAALEQIARALNHKQPAPAWMRTALAAGWNPPNDFNRELYDWDYPKCSTQRNFVQLCDGREESGRA